MKTFNICKYIEKNLVNTGTYFKTTHEVSSKSKNQNSAYEFLLTMH